MSKKQTRMSLSIARELGQALVAFATAKGVPAAQIATRGIQAVLSGEIELGEPVESYVAGLETSAVRGQLTREEVDRRIAERNEERERRIAEGRARIEAEQADALVSRVVHANMPPATKRILAKRTPERDRLDRLAGQAKPEATSAPSPRPFCAVCTNEISGPSRREPFGRDDALVAVCETCALEPPNSGRYSLVGGSSGMGGMGDGNAWISGAGHRRSALGTRR